MKKVVRAYDRFEEYLLVGSLVVTVVVIFLQVIMRKVFNNSLSWSEELARYIFIWQIWYGISIGVRKKKHIEVELIFKVVKGKGETAVRLLVILLNILFCLFMLVVSFQVMHNSFVKSTLTPALRIPLWTVQLSLPFSFFVTMLRYLAEPFALLGKGGRPSEICEPGGE